MQRYLGYLMNSPTYRNFNWLSNKTRGFVSSLEL